MSLPFTRRAKGPRLPDQYRLEFGPITVAQLPLGEGKICEVKTAAGTYLGRLIKDRTGVGDWGPDALLCNAFADLTPHSVIRNVKQQMVNIQKQRAAKAATRQITTDDGTQPWGPIPRHPPHIDHPLAG